MLGQVVYHLLAAAHATRAPWPVVVLVSCLPVVTLGFGAALTHLLQAAADAAPVPAAAGTAVPERAPRPAPGTAPRVRPPLPAPAPARTRDVPAPVTDAAAGVHFAADLAAGELPSVRRIKAELHLGQGRAQAIRAHLAGVAAAAGRPGSVRGAGRGPAMTAAAWPMPPDPAEDDTHPCPVRGCGVPVDADRLTCPPDWRRVPKAVQRALWVAWDDGCGAGTPAHRAAMRLGIAAANRARAAEDAGAGK